MAALPTLAPDTSGSGNSFRLEYGVWSVEANAYADSVSYFNLAASGTKTLTVNAAPQPVSVDLTGGCRYGKRNLQIQDLVSYGGGSKKFHDETTADGYAYNVSYTPGAAEISGSSSYSAEFYLVTVVVEKPGGGVSGRSEIVHIYRNLTTEFGTDTAPIVLTADDFTAIPLTEGVWTDGYIVNYNGMQWFSFTATNATQYIHGYFGSLRGLAIQLYDSSGNVERKEDIL
jgi:hypothetical protein